MLIEYLRKNKFLRKVVYKMGNGRAIDLVDKIEPFLNQGDIILDIGSGTGNVCEILSEKGFDITPLDVKDQSFVDGLEPVIYDGGTIPFDDGKFDKAIILTVLHHTPDPESVLMEAGRVAKSVIVIEDIFTNWFNRQTTYFFDSLFNLEFTGHPHTNKTNAQWKETFDKLGFKLVDAKYDRSFWVFSHAVYYLDSSNPQTL